MIKNTAQEQADYSKGHEIGYKAFMDGNYRNQNPFDRDEQEDLYFGWDEGYTDAKEDNK